MSDTEEFGKAVDAVGKILGINLRNPAALTAFLSGNLDRALVAGTPGGIEAQEAAGQQTFVAAETLPLDCKNASRTDLETLGFRFGPNVDDLFVQVQFPPGWKKRATDHVMWSDLLDGAERVRAHLFYKAAFYDRRAFMRLENRYVATSHFGAYPETDAPYREDQQRWTCVVDHATGTILWHSANHASNDWVVGDIADREAAIWLQAHYPDHANPLAYWDMP